MAGRIPTSMLAVYSGSKAFIDFFSKSLYQEYKSKGVDVISVTPGLVVSFISYFLPFCFQKLNVFFLPKVSQMSKIRKTSLIVASPQAIASRSIDRLGKDIELSPYFFHDLTK